MVCQVLKHFNDKKFPLILIIFVEKCDFLWKHVRPPYFSLMTVFNFTPKIVDFEIVKESYKHLLSTQHVSFKLDEEETQGITTKKRF